MPDSARLPVGMELCLLSPQKRLFDAGWSFHQRSRRKPLLCWGLRQTDGCYAAPTQAQVFDHIAQHLQYHWLGMSGLTTNPGSCQIVLINGECCTHKQPKSVIQCYIDYAFLTIILTPCDQASRIPTAGFIPACESSSIDPDHYSSYSMSKMDGCIDMIIDTDLPWKGDDHFAYISPFDC